MVWGITALRRVDHTLPQVWIASPNAQALSYRERGALQRIPDPGGGNMDVSSVAISFVAAVCALWSLVSLTSRTRGPEGP